MSTTINALDWSPAQYNVLVGSSGGTITSATPNVAGFALTSNGSSSAPTFQIPPQGGSSILIQSQSVVSGTSVTFSTGISSRFSNYLLVISNVRSPAATNSYLQWSTNGGSSFISTGYQCGVNYGSYSTPFSSGSLAVYTTYAYTSYAINIGSAASFVQLMDITNGGQPKVFVGGTPIWQSMSLSPTVANVNAFKISLIKGLIVEGVFTLYGILE